VSIMRGVQGSFLGLPLQEPYRLGCLNARNELSLINADQPHDNLDCRMLGVNDMRPSERAQVIAGLPSGTLEDAITQIEELARSSVLPTCAPRTPSPTTTSATPHLPETPVNPGIPESSPESPAPENPAPETPSTVTAPAPAPPGAPPPGAPPPAPPPSSPTPQPTVTALPPPPPEPGTNCREVS
jgi:PPM family protein phosphatase